MLSLGVSAQVLATFVFYGAGYAATLRNSINQIIRSSEIPFSSQNFIAKKRSIKKRPIDVTPVGFNDIMRIIELNSPKLK